MPPKKNLSTSSLATTKAINKGGRPPKKKNLREREAYKEDRRIYKRDWARKAREAERRLREEHEHPHLLDQYVEQTGRPPPLLGPIQSQLSHSQAGSAYGRPRVQSFGLPEGGAQFVCCHCQGINVLSASAPPLG